jgi:ribosomal protein S21
MKNDNKSNNKSNKKNSKGGDFIAVSSRKFPTDAVEAIPLEVKVYNNFDKAFRAFRTIVQKEKILSLYKEKQSFEKKSDKRRRKRNEMRRKMFEMEMKRTRPISDERKRKRDEETTEEVMS